MMMGMHRGYLPSIHPDALLRAVVLAAMLCVRPAAGANCEPVDEKRLEATLEEIERVLDAPERVVALPSGIESIKTSPRHQPVFLLKEDSRSTTFYTNDPSVTSTYRAWNGKFHAIVDGYFIGFTDDGSFLFQGNRRDGTVLCSSGKTKLLPREEDDSRPPVPSHDFLLRGRGTEPFPALPESLKRNLERALKGRSTVCTFRDGPRVHVLVGRDRYAPEVEGVREPMRLLSFDGSSWKDVAFETFPLEPPNFGDRFAILEGADDHLFVGEKVFRASEIRKLPPLERRFFALDRALAARDSIATIMALRSLSDYPRIDLRDPLDRRRKDPMLAADPSVRRALHLLDSGFRYADGRWFRPSNEDSPRGPFIRLRESLVAECVRYDEERDTEVVGLYRFDARMTSDLLLELPEFSHKVKVKQPYCEGHVEVHRTHVPQLAETPEGDLWIHLAGVGLGRLHLGEKPHFVWICRDRDIAELWLLEGGDRDGRLYYRGRMREGDQGLNFVVKPALQPAPSGESWHVIGEAGAVGFGRDAVYLVVEPPVAPDENYRWYDGDPGGYLKARTIVKYVAGRTQEIRVDDCLRIASSEAAMERILFRRCRINSPVLFMDSGEVVVASDLHDLAKQRFDALMSVASTRCVDLSTFAGPYARMTILHRQGPVLWVVDMGKVEAYVSGKPLKVDERVAVMGRESRSNQLLFGPFNVDGLPSYLLSPDGHETSKCLWIRQGPEGLAFRNGPSCVNDRSSSDRLPVIDPANVVYIGQGLWEVDDPGKIRWLINSEIRPLPLRSGSALVLKPERDKSGLMIIGSAGAQEIEPARNRPMTIIGEETDGSLLVQTTEGLLRLVARGENWEIAETRVFDRLDPVVAEVFRCEKEHILLIGDRGSRRTFITVPRP